MTKKSVNTSSRNREVSRRSFVAGATGATAVIAAPNIIRSAQAKGEKLTVAVWGGDWSNAVKKYYIEPFTKQTGIEVNTISPISFAKLRSMVETGHYEWDVTAFNFGYGLAAKNMGLLEPVNWNVVDKSKLGPADGPTGWKRSVEFGGLGSHQGAWVLAYREDKFTTPPTGAADFWKFDKFPQERMMYRGQFPTVNLWMALIADGLPVIKAGTDAGWNEDRAFRMMTKIKPKVKAWWKYGNQAMRLIGDNEAAWGTMSNARAKTARQKGMAPTKVIWDGAQLFEGLWIVAKGTPNATAAWKFAAFATAAENVGRYCANYASSPMNVDAFQYISEAKAKTMSSYPPNAKLAFREDPLWLAPRATAIRKRYMRWFAS